MTGNDKPGAGDAEAAEKRWEAPPWMRTALLVLLAVGVLGALALALGPQRVGVDLATVERGVVEVAVEEDGRTRVRDRYLVTAPVAGTLRRVELEAGDVVEEGEALAWLDGPASPLSDPRTEAQLRARLGAAEAGVERARALAEAAEAARFDAEEELRRQEVLLAGGSGSTSAVERARAMVRARDAEFRSASFGVQAARGEVEDLRVVLSGRTAGSGGSLALRAPVMGTVLRVHRESGGAVAPGEPLLELGNPAALEAVVDLLSADAVRVVPGAPATLSGWGGEGTLPARVRRVEPAGFTRVSALGIEEQRVNVILEPTDEEGWRGLGDGFRIEARILVDQVEDVPWVPAGALFRSGENWAVFVVEGSRLRERPVQVGRRSQTRAQVVEGLEPGDRVVIFPSDRVEDGARFRER